MQFLWQNGSETVCGLKQNHEWKPFPLTRLSTWKKIDKFYVMYYEALFLRKLNLFKNNLKVDFK